jgi:hypothetical protein
MRLYYFTGSEYALENIRKRRLKISFSDKVNDIFELNPFKFQCKNIRGAWSQCVLDYAKMQGFISFSEEWCSPAMWDHYSDNHTGVCYGFDVLGDQVLKIDYLDELIDFDERALSDTKINHEAAEIASNTKSSHWGYEKEWRQYVSLEEAEKISISTGTDGNIFLEFNDNLVLREVILGMRSNLKLIEVLGALQSEEEVVIRRAHASLSEYKLE